MRSGQSHNTLEYARKRITKLEARIANTELLDPSTRVKGGYTAKHRLKLDRAVLARWKAAEAELLAKG